MVCDDKYSEIENAIFTPTSGRERKSERVSRIGSAIAEIESQIDEFPNDDRYWALLGVARYFLLGEDESISSRSVYEALEKSININGENLYAVIYLACHNYDERQFIAALTMAEKFDSLDISRVSAWQKLKLIEIGICCKINLNPATVTAVDIIKFNSMWLSTDEDDRIFPQELFQTLKLDLIIPVPQPAVAGIESV